MSTHRRVCLQVSGVKLKREAEASTPALHPTVSSCMSVYISVLSA